MDSSVTPDEQVENLNDTEAASAKPRRRSAVFKRQSIARLEKSSLQESSPEESKKIKLSPESSEEPKELKGGFDLQGYIDSLEAESKRWREEYKKRKHRVNELAKSLAKLEKSGGQPLDLTCLSDQQRSFLSARPDYQEFNNNLFKLNELATKVAYLDLYSEHYRQKTRTNLQKQVASATDRIIKLID